MTIELTKLQCENLAEFIELNIFNMIRDDTDIDGIGWLADIMDAYNKLRTAVAKQMMEKVTDDV